MANINVRAKNTTIDKLKELASKTGDSQGQVVENAIAILDDLMLSRESFDNPTDQELVIFAKLILNRV